MVFQATSAALEEAGLARRDIDGVCIAASDQLDGRAISSMLLAAPAGAYLRDEVKVSDESSLALSTAFFCIKAGLARRMLVVSWTKTSESAPLRAVAVNPDPIFSRPIGLHPLCVEAVTCQMFVDRTALDLDEIDELARRMSEGAQDAMLSWPLRANYFPPYSDAAVALVLTFDPAPVELAAIEFGSDHDDPTRRVTGSDSLLASLLRRVTVTAEIPVDDSTVIETTDRNLLRNCMTLTELLGADARTISTRLLANDLTMVNRSGGLWASNPPVAAGLERIVHAVRHIAGGAVDVSIAHSSYGLAGQGQFLSVQRRPA